MNRLITFLICGMALAAATQPAQAALGEARLMFPTHNVITSKPGHVVLMWNTDVDPLRTPISLSVEVPGRDSAVSVEATLDSNIADNDTGESMSNYPYTTLEFDLDAFVASQANYGEWKVSVPAGVVCSQNDPSDVNPAQTLTLYWYRSNGSVSFSPSFGEMNDAPVYNYESLSNVTLKWNGITSMERNAEVTGAFIQRRGSIVEDFIDGRITIDGGALRIDIASLNLAPDVYRIYLPAGYLFLRSANGETQINSELNQTGNWFGVTDGMSSGQIQSPFSSGRYPTISSDIEYVDIKWPGEVLSLGTGTARIYLDEFKDNTSPYVNIPRENISVNNDMLRIRFADVELNESFAFTQMRVIDIPAGLVKNAEGKANPNQSVIFYVEKKQNLITVEPVWSPSSGSRIEASTEITLSWPEAAWINYNGKAYLLDSKGKSTSLRQQDDWHPDGQVNCGWFQHVIVTFDFSNLNLSEGHYTIVIPEAAFSVEFSDAVRENPAMGYKFTIGDLEDEDDEDGEDEEDDKGVSTGVGSLSPDGNGLIVAYNIHGKLLYRGLEKGFRPSPGIYIVNGKKVLIK